MIRLSTEAIDEIKSKNWKTKIELHDKDLNIKTIYTFKSEAATTYYYQCNRHPKCKGKAKFDIKS